MLMTTIDCVPGREVAEVLGMATGSVVTSKNFGKDFMANMKTIVGGEIKSYTEMLEEARKIAVERLQECAEGMGADAVLGVRFTSSAVMSAAAEVTIYGTAVKLK